jgi:hypothetical protein
LVGATLVGLLGACSGAVSVAVPPYATDPACVAMVSLWPASFSGLSVRTPSVDSPAVRAWGDPPVIARCGVEPAGPSTLDCLAVDGVDWLVEPLTDGTRFLTYGRSPALEVLVPKSYHPESLLLPAFTATATALPLNGPHCT